MVYFITSITISYHLIMRFIVGTVISHHYSYRHNWFAEHKFEKRLYKLLKVKKWKKFMPTADIKKYSLRENTLEEIANNMCRNEVIHEVIAVLSYVPILFGIFAGAYPVFIITSVLASMIDMIFVVMQRYNRPRIIKLIERDKRKNDSSSVRTDIWWKI